MSVENERYSTSAEYSTMVDLTGHGSIQNGTTAAVKISLYRPAVQGLDANGRQTMSFFNGDFDYTPPPGVPRPYEIPLAPGESITYHVTAVQVPSATVKSTIAWYVDPASSVGDYADLAIYRECPDVPVSPLGGGAATMNTYIPWGH